MKHYTLDLAEEYPNITYSVKAGELLEMFKNVVSEMMSEMTRQRQDRENENTLVPRIETAQTLKTTTQTLNRWEKVGYLVPQRVGGKVFYKQADIQRILKQEGGNDL
jgi:hypothetical protein